MQIKTNQRSELLGEKIYSLELFDQQEQNLLPKWVLLDIVQIPDFGKFLDGTQGYYELGNVAKVSRFSRAILSIALNELGCSVSIEQLAIKDQHGAPIFPIPIKASLAHSQEYVAIIASINPGVNAFGIDLESMEREVSASLENRITAASEYQNALEYFGSNEALLRIFSAKEAIYKYYYNLSQLRLGFKDVVLDWDTESNGFRIKANSSKFPPEESGRVVYSFSIFGQLLSLVL